MLRSFTRFPPPLMRHRIAQMASHISTNGASSPTGVSLVDLPKSNNFTSHLPPDAAFPTPADSHGAPRQTLGPRMVKEALFTYVRPETTEEPELLAVGSRAMKDIGLKEGEQETQEFKDVVSGNKFYWDEESSEGVYPWAQCYGGWQFGTWAGQLGDGRAISLFESTNPETQTRYEVQLKGGGKTPYSRFADGKAVLRSSIREFLVSEHLNALGIPTTRALALTLTPKVRVARERMEPGAIVTRFAQSWLRIGTFDLLRTRNDRDLIRQLSTYVAEEVFGGWEKLPAPLPVDKPADFDIINGIERGVSKDAIVGSEGAEQNRFTRLYREIVRRNALTVAQWQAYGFMNGVLNTDNTSIFGLSMDYGPFAFMDNFDPIYTPNHDDGLNRYSYRNQPTIIWWNLVRLGESFGELMGAGDKVDEEIFATKGVSEEFAPILVKRAETIIEQVGEEYKAVFLAEYKRLMTARLGLKTHKEEDFDVLFSKLLDTMQEIELDFNHFFRRLSEVNIADIETLEQRKEIASRFFHAEGVTAIGETEQSARDKVASWLESWRSRVIEDWGADSASVDSERITAMKAANPKFVPRSWILDEIIKKVEKEGDRTVLGRVMKLIEAPFKDEWVDEGVSKEESERWCGDVPRWQRAMMCSCSS